jgi:hypothetical protein
VVVVVVVATARQLGASGTPASSERGKLLVVRGLASCARSPLRNPSRLAGAAAPRLLAALAFVLLLLGGASRAFKLPARCCDRNAPPLPPASSAAARFALSPACQAGTALLLPLLLPPPSTPKAAPGAGEAAPAVRSNRSVISRGKLLTRRSRFSRGSAALLPPPLLLLLPSPALPASAAAAPLLPNVKGAGRGRLLCAEFAVAEAGRAGTASLIIRSTVANAARSCCLRISDSRGTDSELRSRCCGGGAGLLLLLLPLLLLLLCPCAAAATEPDGGGVPRVALRSDSRAVDGGGAASPLLRAAPAPATAAASAAAPALAAPPPTSSSDPTTLALPLTLPLALPASSVDPPSKLPDAPTRLRQFELLPSSCPTPSPPGDAKSAASALLTPRWLLLPGLPARLPGWLALWLPRPARSQPAVALAAVAKADGRFAPPFCFAVVAGVAAPASAQVLTSSSR